MMKTISMQKAPRLNCHGAYLRIISDFILLQ